MQEEKTVTLLEEVRRDLEEKKLLALRRRIEHEKAADIAELFEELNTEEQILIYRLLPKELAAEVLVEMSADEQKTLIDSFSDFELRQVLAELYSDDTADLVEEMPANFVRRILNNCPPDMRRSVNELLKYPEGSAGSIMTTEYVRLKADMTVSEAFDHIRSVAIDKETIYTCYVTDAYRILIGIVSAKTLLTSPVNARIGDIMEEDIVNVHTHDDREQVARLFDKYNFLALPVVDNDDRLVGIITIDDAMDVISEETEEDFAKMAAITPGSEKSYLHKSPFEIFLSRIPWLLLLMVSATFTGMIITSFERALAASVILTSFIPMLMDTGGNSGSQASVTIIRGLSLGEIRLGDILRVLYKELRVSFLCGITLSAVNFAKIMLVDGLLLDNPAITPLVALTVSLSLLVTILAAKLIGCSLPILAKRLGFDPAVMASPFITTLVDAISLVVYFSIATSILSL